MRLALLSITEAAKVLGERSRNQLYRKLDSGELASVEKDGKRYVDSEGLKERWAAINRQRVDSPRSRRPRPAPAAPSSSTPPPAEPSKPARQARPVATADEPAPDYNESRARAEFEKANLLELERKTKEGLLLRREDAEHAWARAVNLTRTKLLGVPSVAKQRIPHLELEEVELLTQLIREALEELASGKVAA